MLRTIERTNNANKRQVLGADILLSHEEEVTVSGPLRCNGDGRWQVRVFLRRDSETNRVQQKERTIRGTKKDVERVLAELVAEADEGIGAPAGGVTVAQHLDRWLKHNEARTSARRRCSRCAVTSGGRSCR